MKLRLYWRPGMLVGLLAAAALALGAGAFFTRGVAGWLLGIAATVYGCAFGIAAACMVRIRAREGMIALVRPERILIVAPHQDDCVLCAGGFAARNTRLGGQTHVLYLVQPADEETRRIRQREAISSWALVGCPPERLYHLDLLPAPGRPDPARIREAAQEIERIISTVCPTMLFVPLYEGGHLQHDIANYVVSFLVEKPKGMKVYECPEYSPCVSLAGTPHKVLSMLARLLGGLVSYYGLPEGVGDAPILNLDMDEEELALKRRMLEAFKSQHGDALALHHGHADRVIPWTNRPYRAEPFDYGRSLCRMIQGLEKTRLAWVVRKLFPGDYRSHGLPFGITNMDRELREDHEECGKMASNASCGG